MSGLPPSDAPSILNRSYTITAEVEIPEGRALGLSAQGAEGMLVTMGGRFGGYGLYLLKGKPVFVYNMLDLKRFRWEGQEPLSPGKHTITFDFQYDGPGFGKGGTGVLRVDNNEVAKQTMPHTIPFIVTVEETFDVGVDTRTGVDDRNYKPPFPLYGKLNKVTFNLAPVVLSEPEPKAMHESVIKAKD
jgi:hypothetical protein